MRKAIVIGNCQVKSLAFTLNYLCENMHFDHLQVHSLAPSKAQAHLEQRIEETKDFDLVLTFNLSDKYYGLAADKIDETYAGRPVLRINNLYFGGYHPDTITLGEVGMRMDGVLDQYHSRIALFGFLEGKTVAETVALFNDDTYRAIKYYGDFAGSSNRMLATDEDVDIKWAGRFVELLSETRAMFVVNHPAPRVFLEWAGAIVDDLEERGIATRRPWRPAEDMLPHLFSDTAVFPVYPEIVAEHGLPFDGSYVFKSKGYAGSSFLSLAQFVESEFALFAQVDRERLEASRQWVAASKRFKVIRERERAGRVG